MLEIQVDASSILMVPVTVRLDRLGGEYRLQREELKGLSLEALPMFRDQQDK